MAWKITPFEKDSSSVLATAWYPIWKFKSNLSGETSVKYAYEPQPFVQVAHEIKSFHYASGNFMRKFNFDLGFLVGNFEASAISLVVAMRGVESIIARKNPVNA